MGAMSYPPPLGSVVNRGTPKQTQLNCSPSFPLVANSLNLKMNGKLFSHMLSPESNSSFNPSPVPGTGLTASIALCFICDMPDRQADGQRERPTDTQIANGLPIAYARAQPNPTPSPITIHGAAMCGICVVAFAVRLARLSRLDHAQCLISSAVSGSHDNNNNNRNHHSKSNKLARSVSPLALLCWL